MIAESLVQWVVDWWLFAAIFILIPLAVFAKFYDAVQNWRERGRGRSSADFEADRIGLTKDESEAANKSAYSQTRRSEIRFHG